MHARRSTHGDEAHRSLVRRPARRLAFRPHRAEQGVPRQLVVHARRDRALRVRHARPDGDLPRVLLRPERERGRLPRALRAAARCVDVRGVPVGRSFELRRASGLGDASDPPLGSVVVPRRDRDASLPDLLHRCVPPAAGTELDRRCHASAARAVQRVRRILVARRPALGNRPPHRVLDRAVDPCRRHVGCVPRLRRRVPVAGHHSEALLPPRVPRPGRDRDAARGPPGGAVASEAHAVPRSRPS